MSDEQTDKLQVIVDTMFKQLVAEMKERNPAMEVLARHTAGAVITFVGVDNTVMCVGFGCCTGSDIAMYAMQRALVGLEGATERPNASLN